MNVSPLSLSSDLPISRLSEQFNVNHFIVSQVNPHVVPFMYNNRQVSKGSFIERLGYVLSSEVVHRINQAMDVGVIPGFVQRSFYWMRMIVSQKYQGDITIVPPVSWSDIKNIMTNPDEAEVLRKISVAEKATFQSNRPPFQKQTNNGPMDQLKWFLFLFRAFHH